MTIMERLNTASPVEKLNPIRALRNERMSPGVPVGQQRPPSKLSPVPPKGANRTGIKIKR